RRSTGRARGSRRSTRPRRAATRSGSTQRRAARRGVPTRRLSGRPKGKGCRGAMTWAKPLQKPLSRGEGLVVDRRREGDGATSEAAVFLAPVAQVASGAALG